MTTRGGRPRLEVVGSDPGARPPEIPGAGVLGMRILLGSLGMLFVASLIGYLYIRARATVWPPPGSPALPPSLWLSTAVILGCSYGMHRAWTAIQRDDRAGLRRFTVLTLVLGLAFLVCQSLNWWQLVQGRLTPKVNLYGFTFYMLTGLHAAHVVGGLIPLAIVTRNAFRDWYRPHSAQGVQYCAMYWHFLDAVWVVLFVVLLATR